MFFGIQGEKSLEKTEGTIKERPFRNTGNSRLKTQSEDKQNKTIITKKYKNQTKQTNKAKIKIKIN